MEKTGNTINVNQMLCSMFAEINVEKKIDSWLLRIDIESIVDSHLTSTN